VIVHWFVEEGLVPESWISGEDWPTYHFRLLQGQPISYPLDEVLEAVTKLAIRHTKSQLLERGLAEGVSLAPVNSVGDLAGFKQLEERGYWLTAPLPNGQEAQVPGLVVRMTETPMSVRSWTPTLDEHNNDVLGSMLGMSKEEISLASGVDAG
jgi:formyl-CoA transferase